MQELQGSQSRGFNKRHYSSPGSGIYVHQKSHYEQTPAPKPTFRKTDYTDQPNSQATSSQINQIHKLIHQAQNYSRQKTELNQQNYQTQPQNLNLNYNLNQRQPQYQPQQRPKQKQQYQASYPYQHQHQHQYQYQYLQNLKQKQRRVIQLRERLKNIHHFYKVRIQEQRGKNIQRSQIFIGIMEQLQIIQNQKLLTMQRNYQDMQEEQKQLVMTDQRVSNVNKKIAQIQAQSQQMRIQNQHLQGQISQKQQNNKQKQSELNNLKQQVQNCRDQLQAYQKNKLKQNRRSKELLQMINQHVFQ